MVDTNIVEVLTCCDHMFNTYGEQSECDAGAVCKEKACWKAQRNVCFHHKDSSSVNIMRRKEYVTFAYPLNINIQEYYLILPIPHFI